MYWFLSDRVPDIEVFDIKNLPFTLIRTANFFGIPVRFAITFRLLDLLKTFNILAIN